MFDPPADVRTTLSSIRDYIRWGASQFDHFQLVYGQGTTNALDDAAALILHALRQPYNIADPYLDCRLTQDERETVIALIARRINTRSPVAYLTHEAVFAGLSFYVDERVLVPRSPIAELIENQFHPWIEAGGVTSILDLCTGSGCIAIACAYAFPEATIAAVELNDAAGEVAAINIDKHAVADRVTLYASDLFAAVPGSQFDIIVSNPPYVADEEWRELPPEFHAEPETGFRGGAEGLHIVTRILATASAYLSEHGILVIEVGGAAAALQSRFPMVPFVWLDFEYGGEGVLLLTAAQLTAYQSYFNNV